MQYIFKKKSWFIFVNSVSKWLTLGFNRKNSDQNVSPKVEVVGFSPLRITSYIFTTFSLGKGDFVLAVGRVDPDPEPDLFLIDTAMIERYYLIQFNCSSSTNCFLDIWLWIMYPWLEHKFSFWVKNKKFVIDHLTIFLLLLADIFTRSWDNKFWGISFSFRYDFAFYFF